MAASYSGVNPIVKQMIQAIVTVAINFLDIPGRFHYGTVQRKSEFSEKETKKLIIHYGIEDLLT
jgi:hypothetical protein